MPHKDPEVRRAYHKAYAAKHYQQNKDAYLARSKVSNANRRAENKRRLYEYLREHPCVDCGESDLVVLDLDHRDETAKVLNISTMLQKNQSWVRIAKEIEKCDVRCSNCHRRRTARQFGWLKE